MARSPDAAERELFITLNRRNYLLGIANGIIFTPANRLADLGTVIPLLLLRLSGLSWMVGMGHAITMVAPVVPQVLAARLVDTAPRKRPIYCWCAVIRFIGIVGMALSLLFAGTIGYGWALVGLLFCFTLRVLVQGITSQAFLHIIANSVPTTKRGSFWKWRQLGGLVLVLAFSWPLLRYMLSDDCPFEFPVNYGVLILIGALVMGLAWLIFSKVSEPEAKPAGHRLTMRQHLARGVRLLRRDRYYRRLVRIRILLSAAGAITPFFIAFAVQRWEFHDEVAASFMVVQIVAQMIGCWVAGYISDKLGNQRLLVLAAATILCTAAFAAFGGYLTPPGAMQLFGHRLHYRMAVLMGCFIGSGIFMAALGPAYMNYLMDIAPRRKLPSYTAFASLFIVPIALAPLAYGWLVHTVSYHIIFIISAILALIGLILAMRMGEPRDDVLNGQVANGDPPNGDAHEPPREQAAP